YRQMMSKYKQIESFMQPPFVVERAARGAEEVAGGTSEDKETAAGETSEAKAKKAAPVPKAGKRKSEAEVVEKTSARELFDYVVNEGRKDYTVQRYKGLGEMTAEQLWET